MSARRRRGARRMAALWIPAFAGTAGEFRSAGVPPASPARKPSPIKELQRQVDSKFNKAIVAPPLRLAPVIPAKAGIHRSANSLAARNQARIASDKSPLPIWETGAPRASAALRARRPRSQRKPSLPGNHPIAPGLSRLDSVEPRPYREHLRDGIVALRESPPAIRAALHHPMGAVAAEGELMQEFDSQPRRY